MHEKTIRPITRQLVAVQRAYQHASAVVAEAALASQEREVPNAPIRVAIEDCREQMKALHPLAEDDADRDRIAKVVAEYERIFSQWEESLDRIDGWPGDNAN